MKKHYDEASVVRSLAKKCVVNPSEKSIGVNVFTGQCGNGTWGKIDYLVNYCGYHWYKLNIAVVANNGSDKPNKRRKKAATEDETKQVKFKKNKKQ